MASEKKKSKDTQCYDSLYQIIVTTAELGKVATSRGMERRTTELLRWCMKYLKQSGLEDCITRAGGWVSFWSEEILVVHVVQ